MTDDLAVPHSPPSPRVWTPEECAPFATAFVPATVRHPKPRGRPDADTFDLVTEIRFDAGPKVRIRLCGEDWLITKGKIGFNAWERKGEEKPRGDAAYQRRLELCAPGDLVRIRSFKGGVRGSLNRWLAIVLVRLRPALVDGTLMRTGPRWVGGDDEANWYSLADVLHHEGHGREWWRGWKRGATRPTLSR